MARLTWRSARGRAVGRALAEVSRVLPANLRRRVFGVGSSALLQRLLVAAAAWSFFWRGSLLKTAVGSLLAVVFAVHSFAQRSLVARAEAALVDRVGEAVLDGDLLRSTTEAENEPRLEFLQGVHQTAIVLGLVLPNIGADLAACAILGAVVFAVEPPRLVLLAGVLTVVGSMALLSVRRIVERAAARSWAVQSRAYEAFGEIVEGKIEVVASGLRRHFLDELHERTAAWAAANAGVAATSAFSGRLPLAAGALIVGSVVYASPWARASVNFRPADVALLAAMTPAVAGLAQGLLAIAKTQHWVACVARVLDREAALRPGGHPPGNPVHGIRFQRVSFRYDDRAAAEALKDVTFAWQGTGAFGLTGPNGSGKSSCLRLLAGLASPSEGSVEIGGIPLDRVDSDLWRQRIAFLPQRPYLPSRMDVAEAIRWLAPGATDSEIERALDRVGLLPALRGRAGSPLRARVGALSVGERQRVAVARALCRDAALYLLDEPDANLDRAGILTVGAIVRELARTRVVVFAAHTRDLLEAADRVVTIEGGRVRSATAAKWNDAEAAALEA